MATIDVVDFDKEEENLTEEEPKLKFFINGIKFPEIVLSIAGHIDDLRQCLESEEVLLTNEEIVKFLDLYLRMFGIDRDVDTEAGLYLLNVIFGSITFVDFSEDEEKLDSIKKAFKNLNSIAEEGLKLSDETVENITEFYMSLLLKECSIFLNELIAVIKAYIDINPSISKIFAMCALDDDHKFVLSGCYANDIEDFAFAATSNVVSTKDKEGTDIILKTFSEKTQRIIEEKSVTYDENRTN